MRALVVVDVQEDFVRGSLAVAQGPAVAEGIAEFLKSSDVASGDSYGHVALTKDWHIDPGDHFSETPDYVDSWPRHCEAGTTGAEVIRSVRDAALGKLFLPVLSVFRKGEYEAAYSGFEAHRTFDTMDLASWLRSEGITDIDVVGIATDHCVKATVLDGISEGFKVRVLTDLVAAVSEETGAAALEEMHAAGAELLVSEHAVGA